MALTRRKVKGRSSGQRICAIPHQVMDHPDYVNLSGSSLRLLWELAKQYNGYSNNGDLTAAWKVMHKRGFKSKATLTNALHELLDKRFIVCTRQGQFMNPGKRCALYALSWQPINECIGKNLEVGPSQKPFRTFSAKIINLPGTENGATGNRNWGERGKNHG